VFAPPNVRRLARELDVDLGTVSGSGPSGRITESDVRAAAEGAQPEPAEPETEPEPASTAETEQATEPSAQRRTAPQEAPDRQRTLAAPATRRVADELDIDINAVPAVEERDGEAFVTESAVREYADRQVEAREAEVAHQPTTTGEREERVPYKGVRRTIGEQMERSKYTAPHVSHHDQVVVDDLVETRQQLKPKAEERGINLTYMPFVMKAVTAALKEFPFLNATLDEEAEEIILKKYYNIGMAVATDAGLMVPVVDDVDRKGLLQVASEVDELARKARDRSIGLEELKGSTFSITNYGVIGGEYATPIINYPEVAILGIGELAQRPVVEDGEVVARYTLPLSLTIDHRVIDGAVAAEFTNTLMDYLRDPTLLLLE
jgi:pyruvate dehydrogenase E2 component (dihydrolipoamide acetyltransferase)